MADADRKVALGWEMVEAWNTQNWRKIADMFAPDGVLHSMMVEPVIGREAIYKRVHALSDGLESIELKIRNIGAVGEVLFMERTDTFTIRGQYGETPVVGVLEFDGDLIKVWREYYDRAHLLKAMGLVQDFDQSSRH